MESLNNKSYEKKFNKKVWKIIIIAFAINLAILFGITIIIYDSCFVRYDTEQMDIPVELASLVVIRYPRGGVEARKLPELPPLKKGRAVEVISCDAAEKAVIWSIGAELFTALAVADKLTAHGINVTVIDARFLKPFDKDKAFEFRDFRQYTIENHSISGGLYSALLESLAGCTHQVVRGFGFPDDAVVTHGEVGKLREKYSLTAECIAGRIGADFGKSI